mgnify:FL=1
MDETIARAGGLEDHRPPAHGTSRLDITIPIEDPSRRGELYGTADRNLRLIRAAFDVRITARDNQVRVSGEREGVQKAARVVEELQHALRERRSLSDELVHDTIDRADEDGTAHREAAHERPLLSGTTIAPRTEGQRLYVEAILTRDLTFCLGPAGTGKTYLAVAVSLSLLKQGRIKRIVLARPAVEAGEKLGFLPGDLQAKVNPYLRPLFDAMHDMLPYDQIRRFLQNDVIEVIPLAFMRGRTLNGALIILDEAQNATVSQMLMFLTRLGHHSKMIVTGDDSQSDLEGSTPSGFIDAVRRLEAVPGVGTVRLTREDIVRHPLVQHIVDAYGRTNGTTRT